MCYLTNKGYDEKLRLFEKGVFRKIYGLVFHNTEQKCEIRDNVYLTSNN